LVVNSSRDSSPLFEIARVVVRPGNQTDPGRCTEIILPSGNKSVSDAIELRQLCVVRVD
jgi:hypothetical protein